MSRKIVSQMALHIMNIPALGCCYYSLPVVFWQQESPDYPPIQGIEVGHFERFSDSYSMWGVGTMPEANVDMVPKTL